MDEKNRKLLIEITLNCNSQCIYCYNSKNKDNLEINIEQFLLPVNFIKKQNFNQVVITGGEPLLEYNKLKKIFDYYKGEMKEQILITNGLLLTQKKINELIESGMTKLCISCDGVSEKTQFELRKTHAKKIWSKIEEAKQAIDERIQFELLYTLTSINSSKSDIEKFVMKSKKEEIESIKFQPITCDLNPDIKKLDLVFEKFVEIINTLEEKRDEWMVSNSQDFFKHSKILINNKLMNKQLICPIPESNLFIDYRGQIKKCPILKNEQNYNLETISFEKINCELKSHCLCMF